MILFFIIWRWNVFKAWDLFVFVWFIVLCIDFIYMSDYYD